MLELNKFKIVTVAFILIFIFCVAAIYTNTKDVANNKLQNGDEKIYEINNEIDYNENKISHSSSTVRDLQDRVSNLEIQYNRITQEQDNGASKMNCNIQGVMNGDILVPLSQSESLNEAQNNGKELVLLCSFK